MRVDSHHHFWRYNAIEYPWITDGMERLRRDFSPRLLLPELDAAGIDRVVSVQARQTLEETEWLLDLAKENEFVAGVVGWAPLASPRVRGDLQRLAENEELKGVRHSLQDEPDDEYMLRSDFNLGVSALKEFGLVYDLLVLERHLPAAIRLVDRHPEQVFVLDHLAKPRIREGVLSPWKERLFELARRENVRCKLSGLVTEADWGAWTESDLRPYVDAALEAFGPARLMFGSDWPVCLLACPYQRWWSVARGLIGRLSQTEQDQVLGRTAAETYRLS